MTLLFGTQFVVLEAYHLLFGTHVYSYLSFQYRSHVRRLEISCIYPDLYSMATPVMFGISVAAILGVSECPDDEPIHKHGFIQVFTFSILDERHHDLHFHLMAVIFPPTNFH